MTEISIRTLLNTTGAVLLMIGGTFAWIGSSGSIGILVAGTMLMLGGIASLTVGNAQPGKPKGKNDRKRIDTTSDWSVPGIIPGAPVPILEHADFAAENAEYAGRLFQLYVMDIGLSADVPGDADVYIVQSGRVPAEATVVRPFVTVYAGYPQRGSVELRLFDDEDEEQYNYHEVIDLNNRGAARVIGEAFTPPTDPTVADDWALAVYFNTTLIALHPVTWTPPEQPALI